MDSLIEKFEKRKKILNEMSQLKKKIELTKMEQHLKKLINIRDIDGALEMYKKIQLPGINSFFLDETKRSIQFKNFDRIHKIISNSKDSTVHDEIKEAVQTFMIDEYSLNEVTMDQFINVMNKHNKHFDFFDLFKDIINKKKNEFMKLELTDVLEIDRWIETYIKMVNHEIISNTQFIREYIEYELNYVRLVKDKMLIQNEEEKKFFIKRVDKRWKRHGSEAYSNELINLFSNINFR